MANRYYVNKATGSDSNTGSIADPWLTVQHALTNMTYPAVLFLTGTDIPAAASSLVFPSLSGLVISGGEIDFRNITNGIGSNNKDVTWRGVTLTDCNQANNFFVVGQNRFIDCIINEARSGVAQPCDFVRCTINDSTSNSQLANYVECEFNNSMAFFNGVAYRCVFKGGSYAAIPYKGSVVHCSFIGGSYIYIWNGAQLEAVTIDSCVFENTSAFDAIRVVSTPALVNVRNCVLGANATLLESGIDLVDTTDDTITVTSAFDDADCTPSSELAAITGTDGFVPGAIEPAQAGGGVRQVNIRGGADQ